MEKIELKFEELELSDNIKKGLKDAGYITATEIQQKAIPEILKGRDVIGLSKTGTGKTAAYALPTINRIDPMNKKTQAVILCPTRELAVQVAGEIRKFTKYQEGIKSIAIYGGQNIERQIMGLKKGVQIVIGTPGRVMDHMRRKTLKLDNVKMVVLDEADEMLNMGFEEDIETILKDVPKKRQTLLFSATMNQRILNITKKYLINPKKIQIKSEELTVNNIKQVSLSIKETMKEEIVKRLIMVHNPAKVIIFCNTKKKVDNLIETLKKDGYKAEALHGDIKQSQRDRIMKRLKQGEFQILVATDVVARGIDIQDLELVINYDVPQEEEYYVHRIGRTGRNGASGIAYTFLVGKERAKLNSIQKYAKTKIVEGKIPTISDVSKIQNKKIVDDIQKVIDDNKFINENIIDQLKKQNNDISMIAKALMTIISNKSLTKINSGEKVKSVPKEGNVKLFLSVGKKDNIKAKDIVGSIASNVAISGTDIGKINILDKFSFVEVPSEYVEEVIFGMKDKKIKGIDFNIEVANG